MIATTASLADLLAELKVLGRSERNLIIDRLEPQDRSRVIRLLGRETVTPPPTFDALASLSPWLSESLAQARQRDGHRAAATITQATRDALLEAERLLPTEGAAPSSRTSFLHRIIARRVGR